VLFDGVNVPLFLPRETFFHFTGAMCEAETQASKNSKTLITTPLTRTSRLERSGNPGLAGNQKKKLITKARKHEKKIRQISWFRDEKVFS